MKVKEFFKKSLAVVMAMAMIAPVMGYLPVNVKEVQAEENTAATTEIAEDVIGYEIVPAGAVLTTGSQPTINPADGTYGKFADYLFAGWYTDEKATIAAGYKQTGSYARFVPADVLSVKCQVTDGIVTNTDIANYKDKYVMRFVSSVDSLDYIQVGFELNSQGWEKAKTATSKSVYSRIESTIGSTDKGRDTYSFSSKVIDTKSEYFITAKYPISAGDTANYTVRAFWVTQDGTKVYGADRCVSLNDGTSTTSLNLSVPAQLDTAANTYTATYTDATGTTVSDAAVEVLTSNATNSNVRITVPNKNLKSVTKVTIKQGDTEVTSTLYRYLYTKYNGSNADTSWYDECKNDTEFIIATSADLYGFAKVINDSATTGMFKDKFVYLVSDISANPKTFVNDSTDANYLKWYDLDTETYEDRPQYEWNPIGYRVAGGAYHSFCGTFDGGMHTISNVYYNGRTDGLNAQFSGLFGPLATTSTIKNLYLKDSYFNHGSATYVGGMTGYGAGTFDTIYSNAYVKGAATGVGGLIGATFVSDVKLNKCWFDGQVVSSSVAVGAMVGDLYSGSVTMEDCLVTGNVESTYLKDNASKTVIQAGGFSGVIENSTTLTVKNCLNIGKISTPTGNKRDGLIAGYLKKGAIDIESSYGNGHTYVVGYAETTNTSFTLNDTTFSLSSQYISAGTMANFQLTSSVITGKAAMSALANFDFDSNWSTILTGTPVPKAFKSEVVDTRWYADTVDTYTLYDKADLYGFAELSQDYDFAGKTVKLGADIVVNTNYDATTWATTAPKYPWLPISNSSYPFAGTFDGGMHSIKGIYLNTTSKNAGLFSVTGANALVQNLYLEDSYFTSTASNLGSIAGQADGMFETIKSTAVVNNNSSNTGGLVGKAQGHNFIMRYCWFDGSVVNSSIATGGLIGKFDGSTSKGIIENCLNAGDITSTYETKNLRQLAGLIGTANSGEITITRSLNTGDIEANGGTCASLIGYINAANVIGNYSYGRGAGANNYVVGYKESGTFKIRYISSGTDYPELTDRANTSQSQTINVMQKGSQGNSKYQGTDAIANLAGLDFDYTWSIADGEYPVLDFAKANETSDTRWYHASAKEMVLYDRADLYGFAALSQTNQFSGKTVKLGKDIVINSDYSDVWSTTAPKYVWTPIATGSIPFQGIFDGQLHSISGLYMSTTTDYVGLFARVQSGTIKNVKLENSFLRGKTLRVGSIAGRLDGTLSNVYSNATVIGTKNYLGGLVGIVGASSTLERCWFAGSVTNELNSGAPDRGTGGLVGVLYTTTLTMKNCLNTGTVNAEAYTAASNGAINPCVGGLLGRAYGACTVNISQCLNAGEIKHSATGGYGPIVGYNDNKQSVVMSETYATEESCDRFDVSNVSYESITPVAEKDIEGNAAKEKINFMNYADTCWVCVADGCPVINFVSANSGEQVNVTATDADTTKLATLYSNRTSNEPYALYQGDLHAHAKTTDALLRGDDGDVTLDVWQTQMADLDLDFAATLDHKQATQYSNETTYSGVFVYGTEAGTNIKDILIEGTPRKLHYNMILAEKSQLEAVLKSNSAFGYTESTGRFSVLGYPDFTKAELQAIIQSVKDNNGLFVIPHPMTTNELSSKGNLSDFHFADWIGFEVIYNSVSNDKWSATNINYRAWKELLADGAKMWACSGSDTHGDLSDQALTSIYAAGKGQSYYMEQLVKGNFTAGSVGIQMCMGNTVMGSECNFNGKRLVVKVGEIHTGLYDATHTYRVDIINDRGVVYSQNLTVGSDRIPTNGTFALDAQDCKFYRVEVFDATTNTRIAIGNPIWNTGNTAMEDGIQYFAEETSYTNHDYGTFGGLTLIDENSVRILANIGKSNHIGFMLKKEVIESMVAAGFKTVSFKMTTESYESNVTPGYVDMYASNVTAANYQLSIGNSANAQSIDVFYASGSVVSIDLVKLCDEAKFADGLKFILKKGANSGYAVGAPAYLVLSDFQFTKAAVATSPFEQMSIAESYASYENGEFGGVAVEGNSVKILAQQADNGVSGFMLTKDAVEGMLKLGVNEMTFTLNTSAYNSDSVPQYVVLDSVASDYVVDYETKAAKVDGNKLYFATGTEITIRLDKLYADITAEDGLKFALLNSNSWGNGGATAYLTLANLTFAEKLQKLSLDLVTTNGDFIVYYENEETWYQMTERSIRAVADAGFKYVDLSLYRLRDNADYPKETALMQDGWEEIVYDLKELADELGVEFRQAHSPGHVSNGTNEWITTNKRSIDICKMLGIKNLVIHVGTQPTKTQFFENHTTYFKSILPYAAENGINLLCENTTSKNAGANYNLFTGADMREFIKHVQTETGYTNFHGCWDTGHANCEGSQYLDIIALGDELYGLHFNDNLSDKDSHLMPYYGTMDIDEVMRALKVIGYNGDFTLEVDGSSRTAGTYTGPKLEGGLNAYSTDRFEQEKIAYQVSTFILKKYDCDSESE